MINNTPIKDLFDEFLDNEPNISKATKELYLKTFEYFVTWMTTNDRDIHNTTGKDAIGYRDYLREKQVSPSTIDNYMCPIRKFFTWLNRMNERSKTEYYKNEVCTYMKWERDKNRTFIKLALTIELVYKLLDFSNKDTINGSRNNAMIHLMAFTGLRCKEVCSLNFGDMITTDTSTKLQIQRKGHREKGGTVTITQDILQALNRYWSKRTDSRTDITPMFVNHAPRSKDTRLTPVCISRIIKTALRGIGLDSRKYSAHSLRHTAATLAMLAGAEVWEVGQMLGHTNLQQTERYIHLLGFDIGPEGHATTKIEKYAKSYREAQKRGSFFNSCKYQ